MPLFKWCVDLRTYTKTYIFKKRLNLMLKNMFIIVGSMMKFGGMAILSLKKKEKPHFCHNKNYSYELQMI